MYVWPCSYLCSFFFCTSSFRRHVSLHVDVLAFLLCVALPSALPLLLSIFYMLHPRCQLFVTGREGMENERRRRRKGRGVVHYLFAPPYLFVCVCAFRPRGRKQASFSGLRLFHVSGSGCFSGCFNSSLAFLLCRFKRGTDSDERPEKKGGGHISPINTHKDSWTGAHGDRKKERGV